LTVVHPPNQGLASSGGLRIQVRSDSGYQISGRDSTFVFGGAGRGDARVTVNGVEIPVYPTGGWLAWLPLPDDTVAGFEILAVAGSDTAALVLTAPVHNPFQAPPAGTWIDTTSLNPRGNLWLGSGEGLTLSLRAAPEAEVRGVLADSQIIEFIADPVSEELLWGARASDTRAPGTDSRPIPQTRYVAWWPTRLGPDPGAVLGSASEAEPADSTWMWVEAIVGIDTARARWPLAVGVLDRASPVVSVVNDDPTGTGASDGILPGRPVPYGTYHWFFPNGTVAEVSGRLNDQVRLQLSSSSVAWVNASDVHLLPAGTPPPTGRALSMLLTPGEESVLLRVPLPARVPFRVDEEERGLHLTLYGVAADMDWIQYGGTDSLVQLIEFAQPSEDETVVSVSLAEDVWGYRTRWDGHDLVLEVRRPPTIDLEHPLRGRTIALDAGHPPGGAKGPTGTWEPDIVLAVTLKTAQLLDRYGARAVLTREDEKALGLNERPARAEENGAEVLVSIHANALPDGVNPFENNGTSVYYFHPRSVDLAREVNRALVRQFGYADLGIGRGDLALARPTWMPSILTEGLFMMIPEQEAVLASEDGQWRYARGIVEGVASFLRRRATRGQ
jgi:N-acetylmuramoyl-L-alanine amidase